MPHVNIKHFPAPLNEERTSELVSAITEAVTRAFGCDEGVVSIALEEVEPGAWQDQVYAPEIEQRKHLLHKTPSY